MRIQLKVEGKKPKVNTAASYTLQAVSKYKYSLKAEGQKPKANTAASLKRGLQFLTANINELRTAFPSFIFINCITLLTTI
jgi:hypothetical protein